MICSNIKKNGNTLEFAGLDLKELAKEYQTPLYLYDADRVRNNCRTYLDAMKSFPNGGIAAYASKAASFKEIYRIMKSEGMYVDVVSCGEIRTAQSAGFDLSRAFFHSNNKTDKDIDFAIENGVGYFVADGADELIAVNAAAKAKNLTQKVLLRLTPGIDPHTFEAVSTGKVDSKFGSAIETGQAREVLSLALGLSNLSVEGFHCHVGSQVFDSQVFIDSAEVMLKFIAEMKSEFGYSPKLLDLGGGYGVRYVESDPVIDIAANVKLVAKTVTQICASLGVDVPVIVMEPGRSIVADAGLTLYTVGSVKRIPGYKNYVSVDGGMTDNPRFILYGSKYTVLSADKAGEECDFECSLVGRCCESGDVIQEKIKLPASVKRGDLVAVCTTGAYNYSMASNYNRVPRPAVVMIEKGASKLAVRRETFDDLIALDI